MPPLLGCQKISKRFGATPLFADLSLAIEEGDRIGLVGPNGSGKSTLLRVLAGIEEPDAGVVSFRRLSRLAYVPQHPEFPSDQTVALSTNTGVPLLHRKAASGGIYTLMSTIFLIAYAPNTCRTSAKMLILIPSGSVQSRLM